MGLITQYKYQQLKKEADQGFQLFLQKQAEADAKRKLKSKEKPGGPNYNLLLVYKNGIQFTKFVIDAFRGGTIQPTQASSLLNTQINNFSKLEAILYK